jgi:hypothetical protein
MVSGVDDQLGDNMADLKWKVGRDSLYRGDYKGLIHRPVPSADDSIVRHILFLEGPGRDTPYLSTTEEEAVARRFAGTGGAVWQTTVKKAKDLSVGHLSKAELLSQLNGNGKGRAKWTSPFEVMQARRYVEQWSEHLLDFRKIKDVVSTTKELFK